MRRLRNLNSTALDWAGILGTPYVGVPAEQVPSSGENGAGIAYAWLEFPDDAGKDVRVLITTQPASGALYVYDDSSFTYSGGNGTAEAQLYLDGVAVGTPQPVTITVGGDVIVAPGAGRIIYAGYPPDVVRGDARVIAPGAGRIAVVGHAAQIHQPRGIAPGAAHVAASGHAPVIDQIASIRPHTSHILARGHSPAISQPQTIEPGAGHAVIAGHAPIIVQGLQIRPGAGRILVSGHAPAVEQGGARELQPGTARVMYRGYAPLITGAQAAPPPAHRIYRVPGPLRLFTVPTVEVPCS